VSFFEDLSRYTYIHPEEDAPNTVNIGWLDPGRVFPTGTTSEEFRAKLAALCERRVKQTRGRHRCPFCSGNDRPGGSCEMRVAGDSMVYAAPWLVHHYVVAHSYLPPKEFIEAVLAFA
jgi:hypothetical protein